jgi:acetolactate decarboxylase
MRKHTIAILCFIVSFFACKQVEQPIFQISTIELLLAGNYDGNRYVESLKSQGNFGIGTFNKLDGEMIFVNGEIFKAKSDGTVCDAKETETTPYATVCWFQPSIEFTLTNIANISQLDSAIQKQLPNDHDIYAIKITGMFDSIRVRSVDKQQKPYKPLIEIVKSQATFQYNNILGTVVGFYAPSSLKEIMVKGMHLHFLSDDYKKGGHLLTLNASKKIQCSIAKYSGMQLDLQQKTSNINTSKSKNDIQKDIEKIEK